MEGRSAVMTTGMASGRTRTDVTSALPRKRARLSPIAAAVPRTVAISDEATAA